MIVEEVSHGDGGAMKVRISEMNTGSDGSGALQAGPREYSNANWLTRNSDGTWTHPKLGNLGRVSFANLPK
jgi:hypothetical protein